MRLGIHGYPGSGKSLILTVIVKDYYDEGKNILGNVNFNPEFVQYRKLDLNELLHLAVTGKPFPEQLKPNYKGLVLVCDEFYTIMDSRFRDSASTVLSYLISQSRKRNMKFIHIEQKRGWADIRARALTDKIILCEKWNTETNTICYNDECMKNHKFHYDFIDLYTNKKKSFWINKPKEFYPMYDTEQMFSALSNVNEKALEKGMEKW